MAELGGGAAATGATVGTGQYQPWTGYNGSTLVTEQRPVYSNVQALLGLPQQLFSSGDFQSLQVLNKLVKDGGFSSWEEAINTAALDPEKGSRSWRDYLTQHAEKYQAFMKANGTVDGSGSGSGDGPYSYSDTNTKVDTQSSAAAIIDQTFQSELGRMATEDEINAFTKALNKVQAANPSSTVTSGTQSGNNRTSQTTTTAAFDPTRFAQEWAQSRPEYAETQAATTFMDLLDKAIASPNALDQMIGGK